MLRRICSFICILIVAFASFVWIGGKVKSLGRKFLVKEFDENYSYGNLYILSDVSYFKQTIPRIITPEKDTVQNAKIIAIGDSFIESNYEQEDFPSSLEDKLHMPVFRVPGIANNNPLEYLENIHYQKSDKKVIIVETTELYVIDRALLYGDINSYLLTSPWINYINEVKNKIFDTSEVDYFFKNNIFIFPFRIFFNNLNFQLFGRIDRGIGAYSLNPPMLFLNEEVNFDKNPEYPKLSEQIAKDIKKLADTLEQKYNLKMIYVVIPNKYTIYGGLFVNGSYNNFIPELQTELANRQVNYIDLYSRYTKFKNKYGSKILLYYGGDNHYTPIGKRILVDELINKL